ncbi:hypothetical protein D3C77_679540 [compost metagenome]
MLGLVEVGKGQHRTVALDHGRTATLGDGLAQLRGCQRVPGLGEHIEQLVRALGKAADGSDVVGLDRAVGQLHGATRSANEGDSDPTHFDKAGNAIPTPDQGSP